MIKITYKVCSVEFEAKVNSISEAYKYIQAIIEANKSSFPNNQEFLSEYMCYLVKMKNNEMKSHENHIFKIEKIAEEKS